MTMKRAMILSVGQSSIISLGAFVNTLFVKFTNVFSGAVRTFEASPSRFFAPAAARRGQVPHYPQISD